MHDEPTSGGLMDSRSSRRGVLAKLAEKIDHKVGWHRLPVPFGVLALIGIRSTLRARNLHDTYVDAPGSPPRPPTYLTARTPEGSYNDLAQPAMGMAGTRFARNVPL